MVRVRHVVVRAVAMRPVAVRAVRVPSAAKVELAADLANAVEGARADPKLVRAGRAEGSRGEHEQEEAEAGARA